ncbi:hypothetical protein CIK81_14750 [Brachybacterium sp. JB7]|nr:hypothetical protein CIK81_14750 [Brachybacterium sp. JB7]
MQDAAHGVGQVLRSGAAMEGRDQAFGAEPEHECGALRAVDVSILGDQGPARPTDLGELVQDR